MTPAILDEKCGVELWTRIWNEFGLGKGESQTLPGMLSPEDKALGFEGQGHRFQNCGLELGASRVKFRVSGSIWTQLPS